MAKVVLTYNNYKLKLGNTFISIPDTSIYANDTFIPFPPAGGYQDISVNTTFMNSWNPSSGSASWITFSNITNNAGWTNWGSFRATAASNTGSNRTGTISVVTPFDTWTINCSQNSSSLDGSTQLLLDRMTVQPTPEHITLINDAIVGLKIAGIWNKLDFLAVYAMHTEQAALLDWKGYIDHTNQNGMDFTAYSGFSYDTSMSTSVYINSNFNPSTNGVNYTLNDAMMGVWVEDRGDTAGTALMGTRLSGQYASYVVKSTALFGTINTSDTGILNVKPWNWGLTLVQRESSSVIRGVVNASLGNAVTQASGRPTGRALWIRGAQAYTTPGFSMSLFRASVAGASLTEAEHQNFYNVMNTYMTAIDAL